MNLFNFIKEHIQIIDVIKEYVSIKKAGIYYKGHCPFHHEKDASFTVSPHKQIFYCFGCHATGDVISFIAQIEGCSQLEAAKLIIDKYNIEVPSHLLSEKQELTHSISQKNSYFNLCQAIADWCAQQLHTSQPASTYLQERAINTPIINQFTLGYFPPGLSSLKKLQQYLQPQGFLVKDLIDNHIVIESTKGLYSPFEDRIIFPISDHVGRCCGFGGRIFKPHDERAKYYNSRENNFFNKGGLLFGLQYAKKAIQQSAHAFLVEGYFDCILMAQHGYPNTIATLGTACSSEHLKLLAQFTDTIFVIFDGDAAGLRAMLRLTQLCWHVNINIRIICLPKNEDPASFLGKGNNLSVYIEQAQDIFTFFISNASQQFTQQPLKNKLAIIHELLAILRNIDDKLKQVILLQEAADKLQLPFDVLQHACKNTQHTSYPHTSYQTEDTQEAGETNKPIKALFSRTEQKLFTLILENPRLCEREDIKITIEFLPKELARILTQYAALPVKTLAMLEQVLEPADKQLTYSLIMMQDTPEHDMQEDIIATLVRHYWKSIAQKIKDQIAQAQQQNNTLQVTQLFNQLQELKKKMLMRSLL